jgi:hypothetical protein
MKIKIEIELDTESEKDTRILEQLIALLEEKYYEDDDE